MNFNIYSELASRILVMDGAMGTIIQDYKLEEKDYRGSRFANYNSDLKGNNDLLSLTQPRIIQEIHEEYLDAGADIIETNTFNANRISLADYQMEDLAYEMNKVSAQIAKNATKKFIDQNPAKTRFVAGAMGPTNKTASLSPDVNNPGFRAVSFDDLYYAYKEQTSGLIDGGVDILLIETIFDTLNAKAAMMAVKDTMREKGINLPVMVILDAFFLSHTSEPVDLTDQEIVDEFLPQRVAQYKLDPADPHAFGALVRPDAYMEMRWQQQEAMRDTLKLMPEVDDAWAKLTGRKYGAIETYRTDGAELLLLITSGTITSTARHVVDERREKGEAVGLVKVKMFRPFPTGALRKALAGADRVAVLDRNISPGHGGIFAEEIRSALYDVPLEDRPQLFGYVLGLGGRDVTPSVINSIVDRTLTADQPERPDLWVGVEL